MTVKRVNDRALRLPEIEGCRCVEVMAGVLCKSVSKLSKGIIQVVCAAVMLFGCLLMTPQASDQQSRSVMMVPMYASGTRVLKFTLRLSNAHVRAEVKAD